MKYITVFINGKQKRVKRPDTINGMDADEFIRRNADPLWIHQNEMWEYIDLTENDDIFLFDEFDEGENSKDGKER